MYLILDMSYQVNVHLYSRHIIQWLLTHIDIQVHPYNRNLIYVALNVLTKYV